MLIGSILSEIQPFKNRKNTRSVWEHVPVRTLACCHLSNEFPYMVIRTFYCNLFFRNYFAQYSGTRTQSPTVWNRAILGHFFILGDPERRQRERGEGRGWRKEGASLLFSCFMNVRVVLDPLEWSNSNSVCCWKQLPHCAKFNPYKLITFVLSRFQYFIIERKRTFNFSMLL